ncbi:hypothetical protein BGZ63DRAFT_417129 [Mariannaea sp. PMI_226]|nr:hypothetical protein BGZ63DRAFT_417129 [Mariannaea sp. PMI_226]
MSFLTPNKRGGLIYSSTDVMVLVCTALSLYNCLELLAMIVVTFRRYRSLYFWSLFITTFGIIPYSVGWSAGWFGYLPKLFAMILSSLGWYLLVTGQSVVLYSRLHLVLYNEKILRAVLWMIIINGCTWHTTMTVLLYTQGLTSSRMGKPLTPIYSTLEKVQLAFFCLQEFIISGLYLWKVVDILRTSVDQKRRFMWYLVIVNVVIIVMDIGLLVIMYKNHFLLEQGIKVVIYSVKLKLEFATLSKLVEFVKSRGDSSHSNATGALSHHAMNSFVDHSSSRSRADDKRPRSGDPGTSSRQASNDDTTTRQTETRESSLEIENIGARQLYDAAVRQISKR